VIGFRETDGDHIFSKIDMCPPQVLDFELPHTRTKGKHDYEEEIPCPAFQATIEASSLLFH
jgi:hypothetical protein